MKGCQFVDKDDDTWEIMSDPIETDGALRLVAIRLTSLHVKTFRVSEIECLSAYVNPLSRSVDNHY